MIPFHAEINPTGATAERRLESLVSQLRLQNEQLRVIINDLYKQIEKKEK